VPDPLLAAVLCALAGVRRGNRVAVVGVSPLAAAALLKGAEARSFPERDADVVVAGAAYEVPAALGLLAAGGRLVAVAADAGAARRVAASAGLVGLHVLPLAKGVAWSARRPAVPVAGSERDARDIVPR
jgi:hypothetical protein